VIFVTIGTDRHPFNRIFAWIRQAREQKIIAYDERIVVQYGYTKGDWHDFEAYSFLPFDEMIRFFRVADLVITHGSSTALLVVRYGKIPLVVPRRKHLGEHVDDHQWEFVESTQQVLPFVVARTTSDFFSALTDRKFVTHIPGEFESGGRSAAVDRFARLFTDLLNR
jgi:UDP-N-acetylglucosamine transferase subunit ALG13